MNQQNQANDGQVSSKIKMDANKLAESMPVDPGTENICLSCE